MTSHEGFCVTTIPGRNIMASELAKPAALQHSAVSLRPSMRPSKQYELLKPLRTQAQAV